MGGYPCYKLILCGKGSRGMVESVSEIALEKNREGTLSSGEFQTIISWMERVEEEAQKIANQLAGLPY